MNFLRRTSGTHAGDTTSLTIVYEVENTGVLPIRNIVVTDTLNDFRDTADLLMPGERSYFLHYASLQSDSVSAPTLEYTAGDDDADYFIQLDELPLIYTRSLLDVSLTAGRSIFAMDTAEVILRLENGGNVAYRDIVIYDDIYGGVIDDHIVLPAGGEPVEIAHSYPLRGTADFRWRVTGVNDAGETIDLITETTTVYADDLSDEVLLTLDAQAKMNHISRKGYVPVTLSLTNIASGMATDVLLREETLGEIATLAVVPTGDPTQYTLRCEITADTVLHFTAEYTDPDGQLRIAEAGPVEIVIAAGGEIPEAENPQSSLLFDSNPQQFGESPLFWILLGSCCAILMLLVVLLLVATRRDRIQRKVRDEVRRQRSKAHAVKRESNTNK